jgi:signal transduction histidine kinase
MPLSFDFRSRADREQERLEQLVACFQAFAGHELPNALVAVQGLARLLARDEALPEEARAMLGRLAALAQKADLCSRRLAEIGRLLWEPGFGPPVELSEAVREAAAEVNARHRETPIELSMPPSLPALPLSAPLLRAVLVQLFANAAKARPECEAEPRGGPRRPSPVEVTATMDEDGVWLALRDHGRGMNEAELARLSEPFAAARQPGATGFGLGFFLVLQAAAKWGGAVRVETEPRGTTVSLLLPLSPSVIRDESSVISDQRRAETRR